MRVRRGSERLDRLDATEIRVVQRETRLEQQVYDGRLSAVLFLKDLRVGDVIEYAYTILGADPTDSGRYTDALPLATPEPLEHLRARVIVPKDRHLQVKIHGDEAGPELEPQTVTTGDETEYLWDLKKLPGRPIEPDVPSWHDPYPWAQLTEFESWQAVATWGQTLFDVAAPPPGPLRDWVRTTRKASTSRRDFLLRATRFVQDEVRYAGIEVGIGRRRPSSPQVVFERRYGDCKDKTALLVAMLSLGGVDASPALVSSSRGQSLDSSAFSPAAFDHAIVRADAFDGQTYWIDPTVTLQGGGIERLKYSEFARALVLTPRTTALTSLSDEPVEGPVYGLRDHFDVAAPGAAEDTRLDAERTYAGGLADYMRRAMTLQTVEQVSQEFVDTFQDDYPGIHVRAPVERFDDRDHNIVRVVAHLGIPRFWTHQDKPRMEKVSVVPRALERFLTRPSSTRRAPISIPYPFRVHGDLVLALPFELPFTPETTRVDGAAFAFDFASSYSTRELTYSYDLKSQAHEVLRPQLAAHLETVDRIRTLLTRTITYRPPLPEHVYWPVVVLYGLLFPFLGWAAFRIVKEARTAQARDTDPEDSSSRGRWGDGERGRVPFAPVQILLGLSLIMSTLTNLWVAIKEIRLTYSAATWLALSTPDLDSYRPGFAIANVLEHVAMFTLGAYGLVLIVLYYEQRRRLAVHYALRTFGTFAFLIGTRMWASTLTPPLSLEISWSQILWAAVISGLWITYLNRSPRAKATFAR